MVPDFTCSLISKSDMAPWTGIGLLAEFKKASMCPGFHGSGYVPVCTSTFVPTLFTTKMNVDMNVVDNAVIQLQYDFEFFNFDWSDFH